MTAGRGLSSTQPARLTRGGALSAAATAPASPALSTISRLLAARLRPSERRAISARSQGVAAAPGRRRRWQAPIHPSISSMGSASSGTTGLQISTAPPMPSAARDRMTAAISSGVSTRRSTGRPLWRAQKAGMSSVRYPTSVTPIVSSTSRVRGRSRITFGPEQTTATGVCASSNRSADTSMLASPPRWTPPIPPVANSPMPARCARIIVADTVVAPSAGACAPPDMAAGRLRRDSFSTPDAVASRAMTSASRPTCGMPSSTAVVAGTAPALRTAASASPATSIFSGCGRPWLISVDSSATSGVPAFCALRTSSENCKFTVIVSFRLDSVAAGRKGGAGRQGAFQPASCAAIAPSLTRS